jgi:hypothetical protein
MILRLTHRLATKLGLELVPSLPPAGNSLCDWTAHLFMAGRLQYIIVTNTTALYSYVIPGGRCRSECTLMDTFAHGLADVLGQNELRPLADSAIDGMWETQSSAGPRIDEFWGQLTTWY